MDKIEWDENGKCINIVGLRSSTFFNTDKEDDIRITSDVLSPKLINGILFLKLEGKGETEFKFKFSFGQIISIEPSLFN